MAEECPIDCQIKSQIECPIEFPIKCQLCHIECPIECPIKCQHICHNMECQNRMPGWMFYFGKMLGNVCQMECRNVCQITCHKKIWCQKICHGRVVFLKKIIRSLMAPSPPHLTEATAGSASTAHPADAAHAPRCTSRSGAPSWNLRSNGSWAPQTPGRQLKVRKAWGTNRISIPFVIGHNSQHGVQLARTFLMSSNHYIYNNIYIYI